jgi:hypothetical protein
MRKAVGLVLLVAGPLYLRRRRDTHREHVHLEFDDGSAFTLTSDASEAQRLLALARQAL